MPVDQPPTRQPPRRSDDTKLVRYEDYIESKIQSTRWMVKAVDLATALVTLLVGVLAYLLIVAVAEHWIVPGGFSVAARTALFTVLVIGVGYFSYRRVWPLLVRAINPVYAARAIEQGSPTLKNSLINLLFFRERRAGISDAVYRTLEEQAAQRLTRVPVETTVDRSLLIHLGYVLVGVVAIAGLYKVLSPKDPLISAERILLPWADIVPASRVTIREVTPGSLTVSRGEFVDVSAEVHGLGDDDAMVLRYTTDDGQVVGKAIPMKPASDGLRYACRVADEADGSESVGLTRSLKYRLEAGDARSLDYTIKVVSAPSILVEHVDYRYPPYTGYVDRTVDGLGDIRAIEGTRMTIHARANGAIRVADVDFDADGRSDLRMTPKENGANASFELSLREDRQTPRHASYVLRFTNDEGRVNRDPVKHSIAVDRDYDPEASVLSPKEKSIDARLDETVAIEMKASDPDFKLSAVRLRGEAAGKSVLDEALLKAEHRGWFTARYAFVANAHGLKAGDVVEYWVEADDNRTPKPNTVSTKAKEKEEKRTIRIVSPNPAQQPPPDRIARNDRQQPKPGADQQGGQQDQGGQQGGKNQGEKNQGGAAGQNDHADQQQGGEAGGQQQPGQNQGEQKGEKQQGGGEGNKGGEQNPRNEQQQSKGDSKSGGEGKATNAQGGDQKGNDQKSGEKGQGGPQSKSKDGSSDSAQDQQQDKGEQTGAGASGGEKSKDNAQPDGARPEQGDKSQQPNGGQQKGEKQTQPGDQKTAVSSEGDNDGEAFERIQKHMEQNGELKKDGENSEGEKGRGGEGEKKQQEAGKDKREGESKPGDSKSQDGQSASADGKSGEKPGDLNQKQQPGQPSKDKTEGTGVKPNGDDPSQKKEQKSEDGTEQQKSPEGQETGSKGPGGAGEEKQSQSSPTSQPDKKPIEKHQQQGSKEGTSNHEPPAGAGGKKESDSSGDQGGDKSGGGEEGAGQKAPREGTGSAGQNQSADEGSGESAEKGKGDKSSSGGKDAKSDHETGSSDGKTPGKGNQQKDGSGNKPGGSAGKENAESPDGKNAAGEKGDKAGSKEGEAKGTKSKAEEEGKQADKQQEKDGKDVGKQGEQQGGEAGKNKDSKESAEQGKSGGQHEGGGLPGGAVNPQPSITGSAPEGEAANLEYARKQTDLVLDKLSNQLGKNKVDDRMLKELGWTRDDLRRFVERWQQRKDAAERDDPKGEAAKRELDEALRSLGLQRDKLQQNAVQKDSMRDLKQGYRGPVPLEYQERLRAYNQGVSRAARDGE